MSAGIIVDFNSSSLINGIHIEMPSCWKARIPVEKISLILQEEYRDDDEDILETYIHLSEKEGAIERIRLPDVRISDLEPFLPEGGFISLMTDSDIDYETVVPCVIAKQHIHDVKDAHGMTVQVNVQDCVVVSKCLVTYQMAGDAVAELDKLFSKEVDKYGWRKRMPALV